MNIVRLSGGLGTQMFQYAFALALKAKGNDDIRIDTRSVGNEAITKVFSTTIPKASGNEIKRTADIGGGWLSAIRRTIFGKSRKSTGFIEIERDFTFKKEMLEKTDTYFKGLWQSWKYFDDISEIIHKEFTFGTPVHALDQACIEAMENGESVAIHIRRRKNISKAKSKDIGSICSPDYYNWAIASIRQQIGENVHFYLFSEDMEWVKKTFPLKDATYVDWNTKGKIHYNDLRLMTHCKHNIIANSAFGWWAAYLNNNPDKIVIAPSIWRRSTPTPDLMPQWWVQLPID